MGYFQAGSIGYLAGGTTGAKTSNETHKVQFKPYLILKLIIALIYLRDLYLNLV